MRHIQALQPISRSRFVVSRASNNNAPYRGLTMSKDRRLRPAPAKGWEVRDSLCRVPIVPFDRTRVQGPNPNTTKKGERRHSTRRECAETARVVIVPAQCCTGTNGEQFKSYVPHNSHETHNLHDLHSSHCLHHLQYLYHPYNLHFLFGWHSTIHVWSGAVCMLRTTSLS